mgnify:CR=1 FL=1
MAGNSTIELRKLAFGDEDEWSVFLSTYTPMIKKYLMSRFKISEEEFLDLWQNILISLINKLREHVFRDVAHLRRWLYLVSRNRTIDWIRKLNREAGGNIEEYIEDPSYTLMHSIEYIEGSELSDVIKRIYKVIVDLPEEDQRIIHYRFSLDYTLREIAKDMELQLSTVKSKYYRLLDKMQDSIDDLERSDAGSEDNTENSNC